CSWRSISLPRAGPIRATFADPALFLTRRIGAHIAASAAQIARRPPSRSTEKVGRIFGPRPDRRPRMNNMKRRKQKANTSKPASSPPLNAPAQALSGDETKRRMALVNADREIDRKIMTEPGPRWEPQSPPRAENAANCFRWAANAPFEQGAVGDPR